MVCEVRPLPVSLLLFDLNDVLYGYSRTARIDYLARISGRDVSAVQTAIWGSGFEDLGDAGAMDAEAYLKGFGQRLGYDLTVEEWSAALKASLTPLIEVLALVERASVNAKFAVLTNNNMLVRQHRATLFPDLRLCVEDSFRVSAEFGARKPEPEVYSRCVAALGTAASETLFIDDSAKNTQGAERAGLRAYRYTTVGELTEVLGRYCLV